MAYAQTITKVIMQTAIRARKALVLAMVVATAEAGTGQGNEAVHIGPRLSRPSLKLMYFHWSAADKYVGLRNIRLEINNIFPNI